MSISFYGYVKNGDRFNFAPDFAERSKSHLGCPDGMDTIEWINSDIPDEPNPTYDRRIDVNLSQANANEVLSILGLHEDGAPLPVEQFLNIVATRRRNRLGKVSPALNQTYDQQYGTLTIIDGGRPEGYIETILQRLSILAQAAKEYGADYVGWG